MGAAASSIPVYSEEDDRNIKDYIRTLADLSLNEQDPNGVETGEIVWLINFSQFSIYGKYPPPKPKHNNLNVCRFNI